VNTQEVLELALAMGAGEENREVLLPLCQASVQELAGRLKCGLSPEDCGAAFPVAAAFLALDSLEPDGGVTAFTAGDVTVRRDGSQKNLRRRAEALLAPYIQETGFAFRGVRG